MLLSKQEKTKNIKKIQMFSNVQVMAVTALMIALSIVLGKYLSFTFGAFRISFENLTIIMAGIMFGPAIGLTVGVIADLIGCLMVGYTINPIITIGVGCIGLIAGIVSHYFFKQRSISCLITSVFSAHILSSMIIKSIGLHIYFGFPLSVLILRVPLYIVIGTLECYIIYLLFKNKTFSEQVERMCNK